VLLSGVAILAWAFAALGLGSLLALPAPRDLRVPVAGFAGLYVLAAASLWLNLVAPVTPAAAGIALVAGLAAFASRGRRLLPEIRLDAAGLVLAFVLVVAMTPFPSRHYDTGLYHLQAVAWARAGSIPPGLANLHGRLGFNSSWFPLAALLEAPGLAGRGHVVLNALPLLFLATAILPALRRIRAGDWSYPTVLLASGIVAWTVALPHVGSLYQDPAVSILIVLSLALWARGLSRPGELPELVPLLLAAAALSLTVKLSAAPLAAGAVALLALSWRSVGARRLAISAAAVGVLLLPWVLRGLVSSGCVAYPAAWTCLDALPWSVAPQDAVEMESSIRWWARVPGILPEQARAQGAWIPGWSRRVASDPVGMTPILVFATGLAAYAGCGRRAPLALRGPLLLALLGVASWFALAPDPRFGSGFLLGGGLLGYSWAISQRAAFPTGKGVRSGKGLAALVAAALLVLLAPPSAWMLHVRPVDLAPLRWPEVPRPDIRVIRTVSGKDVRIPVGTNQCWRTPIPCAPDGSDGLALRQGFAVDAGLR
jgi:hypothetical protein